MNTKLLGTVLGALALGTANIARADDPAAPKAEKSAKKGKKTGRDRAKGGEKACTGDRARGGEKSCGSDKGCGGAK